MTPALLALYGTPPAPDFSPATDAVQTMEPLPFSTMIRAAYFSVRNAPTRFTLRMWVNCSTVVSKRETRPPLTPAFA